MKKLGLREFNSALYDNVKEAYNVIDRLRFDPNKERKAAEDFMEYSLYFDLKAAEISIQEEEEWDADLDDSGVPKKKKPTSKGKGKAKM